VILTESSLSLTMFLLPCQFSLV